MKAIILALLLAGCAGQFANTPAEIREAAKIKDAHAGCNRLGTPYGNNSTAWGNADKDVVGEVTVKCDGMELTIRGKTPTPASVPVELPAMRLTPR